jgi:phosphoglycolate phosphatase-like HAD superfamily hydrolase
MPQTQRAKAARDTTRESRLAAGVRAVLQWPRVLGAQGVAMVAGAVIVVVAVAVTGYFLSRTDTKPKPSDTRARHYEDVDVCLLTGKDGITAGTTAAEVWQGMRDASRTTHARVSHVPVTGEQSAAHARAHLDGLLQRSCDVVLVTGKPEVTAATQTAPQHQKVDFVLVGDAGTDARSAKNITVARVGDGLRAEVAGVVEREAEARG